MAAPPRRKRHPQVSPPPASASRAGISPRPTTEQSQRPSDQETKMWKAITRRNRHRGKESCTYHRKKVSPGAARRTTTNDHHQRYQPPRARSRQGRPRSTANGTTTASPRGGGHDPAEPLPPGRRRNRGSRKSGREGEAGRCGSWTRRTGQPPVTTEGGRGKAPRDSRERITRGAAAPNLPPGSVPPGGRPPRRAAGPPERVIAREA